MASLLNKAVRFRALVKDFDALAQYISVLEQSRKNCHQTEDRPRYARHLAVAAEMFAAIHNQDFEKLANLVEVEEKSWGYEWLSHEEGEQAHNAWHNLLMFLRDKNET